MTSELKSESYARLTFSPEDARVQFDKQFTKNCSVEFVNMLSGLVKACGRYDHVTPKYLGSGKNLVFYYLHKDNDSKVKRLIGIDVHWDTDGEGQGLLISDGKQIRVTMTETNAQLESISTSGKRK